MLKDAVQAVVQKVVLDGKHGPYVVTTSTQVEGSITFSLDGSVWQERGIPSLGSFVLLLDLVKKQAGWRAMYGRFVRPSDDNQQPATRKE